MTIHIHQQQKSPYLELRWVLIVGEDLHPVDMVVSLEVKGQGGGRRVGHEELVRAGVKRLVKQVM